MYYLVINDKVVFESPRLLDCTDEEETYQTTDSDKVQIWDDNYPIIRKRRQNETIEESGWDWKICLHLVKDETK